MVILKKEVHLFKCDECSKIIELAFESKKSYYKILKKKSKLECDCGGELLPYPN